MRARWRWPAGVLAGCVFALAGGVNRMLAGLDQGAAGLQLAEHGVLQALLAQLHRLPLYIVAAAILMFTLRAGQRRGAHSPWRFLLVLALAAGTLNGLRSLIISTPSFAESLDGWVNMLLWGGLFGWLYLLYLQRRDDLAHLDTMLTGRALLARQLAQSDWLAARARLDPAMVAGVLREVHARYAGGDAAAGAALLDQLVGYLRLALNRSGAGVAPGDTDAALRALCGAAAIPASGELP